MRIVVGSGVYDGRVRSVVWLGFGVFIGKVLFSWIFIVYIFLCIVLCFNKSFSKI